MSTNSSVYSNFFKTAFKKNLRPSIERIQEFLKGGSFKLMLAYVDMDLHTEKEYEADIELINTPNKTGFDFKISIGEQLKNGGVKYLNSYGLDGELRIYGNGSSFRTSSTAIDKFDCNFPKLPRLLTGILTNLRSDNKPYDSSYFRLCIPVDDGDIVYPASIIEPEDHLKFDIKQWDTQPSLIGIRFPSIKGMYVTITIQEKIFHLYAVEDVKSVFIDSLNRMDFEEFKTLSSYIRLAFAFLSSRFYSGESLILTSKDKNFKKIADVAYDLDDINSIRGKQQLINPTQLFEFYRNLSFSETFREKFKDAHERFSSHVFSRLCDMLHQNLALRRALEILVNSSSANDPLQQGILCSVALETVTELISDENQESIKPISNKQTARRLIDELKKVVVKHENLSAEAMQIINSKLSDLNKPTNKNKLLFPFKLLGLALSKKDENILNHRNHFLHGRNPVGHAEVWELEQIALKLHYLTGIVILKYAGYSGHVMNLPAWILFNNQQKMKDTFPFASSKQLTEITNKIKEGTDLSDEDYMVIKDTGRLSKFMEDIICLI